MALASQLDFDLGRRLPSRASRRIGAARALDLALPLNGSLGNDGKIAVPFPVPPNGGRVDGNSLAGVPLGATACEIVAGRPGSRRRAVTVRRHPRPPAGWRRSPLPARSPK